MSEVSWVLSFLMSVMSTRCGHGGAEGHKILLPSSRVLARFTRRTYARHAKRCCTVLAVVIAPLLFLTAVSPVEFFERRFLLALLQTFERCSAATQVQAAPRGWAMAAPEAQARRSPTAHDQTRAHDAHINFGAYMHEQHPFVLTARDCLVGRSLARRCPQERTPKPEPW